MLVWYTLFRYMEMSTEFNVNLKCMVTLSLPVGESSNFIAVLEQGYEVHYELDHTLCNKTILRWHWNAIL